MFELRRPDLWADRTMTVTQVRQLIDSLDPIDDCAEITHLSLEVITPPVFAQMAYGSGFARGTTHPAEAIVTYRGGGYVDTPIERDLDTMTFFGLLHRYGPHSSETQTVVDRIQHIHHDVRGVGTDLQLHILGLMIYEPERWARDLGAPTFFSAKENEARYHFWAAIGQKMGLQGIFASYDEVEPWVDAFEAKHSKYSTQAAATYQGQIKAFQRYFPGPSKWLAGQYLTAGLPARARSHVGAPRLIPGIHASLAAVLSAELLTERVRPVNLSSTWVKDFSRAGDDPDVQALGYQHDIASDPRYAKAGDPHDGYAYSVEHGLESARGCPMHGAGSRSNA